MAEILPATSTAPSSAGSSAGLQLANDFNRFLTLLTTQLQNQDPLAPMDSTQFTEQLALFTNVEQTIAANRNLETLISLTRTNQMTSALGFLGTQVQAEGGIAPLINGQAEWLFSLEPGVQHASITIRDADGAVVFNGSGPTGSGENIFIWDGIDNQGVQQPDGFYEISVLASNDQDLPVPATTLMSGVVTSVDSSSDPILLTVNGTQLSIDQILSIGLAPEPPAPDPTP